MSLTNNNILIFFLFFLPSALSGQADNDPPQTPLFTFVTIDMKGYTEMRWNPSSSDDVAGYVIYLYKDGEGYAIDTLYNPAATIYSTFRPGTARFSESYVIAAMDTAGNISPLSNVLHTVYTSLMPDTCNRKINISWNNYSPVPVNVTGYNIMVSENGGTFSLIDHMPSDATSYEFEDISNGSGYCFRIGAVLTNGLTSGSNTACTEINVQNPPKWINADYATVNDDGSIALSFSVDPSSEISLFNLERKTGYNGAYQSIDQIRTNVYPVLYSDKTADQNKVNFYRLSAVNNCDIKVTVSNVASNIVINEETAGDNINLSWNQYRTWNGEISSTSIFVDTGSGFDETVLSNPADTLFSVSIPDIMYELKGGNICFYIMVTESNNPYGITGTSMSNQICLEIEETITVPNIFTPDGDLKNDLFRPFITFTPLEYSLVISNLQRKVVFETNDFLEAWDGLDHGSSSPEGVYIWFLRVKTPSGKNISRTGTVTVLRN